MRSLGARVLLDRVPGFAWALVPLGIIRAVRGGELASVRPRTAKVTASVLLAGVLVTPYVVNCWLVYGDPLYAINAHTQFYRQRAEMPDARSAMGWSEYISTLTDRGGVRVTNTFATG